MSVTPNLNQNVAQLIDANLDRAREGLRVIEDWCRFGLHKKEYVILIKDWRQQLGQQHYEIYKKARLTSSDESAGLNHPAQKDRKQPKEIVAANFARVQEALRVLEEFCRSSHPELSTISAKIRYKIYDLEISVLKDSEKNNRFKKLHSSKLYLITKPNPNLFDIVLSALNAGVNMIQYRCKNGNDLDNFREANALALLCKKKKSLLIINDRIDIALACDADGVHLGQTDIPLEIGRKMIGPEKIIGLSTHSLDQIKQAENKTCDYVGIGPIFPTVSKPSEKHLGLESLKKLSLKTNLPYFAIGGINKMNISEITKTGTKRVAIINGIMDEKDTSSTVRYLIEKLK